MTTPLDQCLSLTTSLTEEQKQLLMKNLQASRTSIDQQDQETNGKYIYFFCLILSLTYKDTNQESTPQQPIFAAPKPPKCHRLKGNAISKLKSFQEKLTVKSKPAKVSCKKKDKPLQSYPEDADQVLSLFKAEHERPAIVDSDQFRQPEFAKIAAKNEKLRNWYDQRTHLNHNPIRKAGEEIPDFFWVESEPETYEVELSDKIQVANTTWGKLKEKLHQQRCRDVLNLPNKREKELVLALIDAQNAQGDMESLQPQPYLMQYRNKSSRYDYRRIPGMNTAVWDTYEEWREMQFAEQRRIQDQLAWFNSCSEDFEQSVVTNKYTYISPTLNWLEDKQFFAFWQQPICWRREKLEQLKQQMLKPAVPSAPVEKATVPLPMEPVVHILDVCFEQWKKDQVQHELLLAVKSKLSVAFRRDSFLTEANGVTFIQWPEERTGTESVDITKLDIDKEIDTYTLNFKQLIEAEKESGQCNSACFQSFLQNLYKAGVLINRDYNVTYLNSSLNHANKEKREQLTVINMLITLASLLKKQRKGLKVQFKSSQQGVVQDFFQELALELLQQMYDRFIAQLRYILGQQVNNYLHRCGARSLFSQPFTEPFEVTVDAYIVTICSELTRETKLTIFRSLMRKFVRLRHFLKTIRLIHAQSTRNWKDIPPVIEYLKKFLADFFETDYNVSKAGGSTEYQENQALNILFDMATLQSMQIWMTEKYKKRDITPAYKHMSEKAQRKASYQEQQLNLQLPSANQRNRKYELFTDSFTVATFHCIN